MARTWAPQGETPIHRHRQSRRDKISVISGTSVSPNEHRLGLCYLLFYDNIGQEEVCLPWQECAPLLESYCNKLGLPRTADELVQQLRMELETTAVGSDAAFPTNGRQASIRMASRRSNGQEPTNLPRQRWN